MLDLSRRLNPECEHVQGDMRPVRLGRVFDCVLVHDAVSYMASRADLQSAIATAFEHTATGGAAMFQPDVVARMSEAVCGLSVEGRSLSVSIGVASLTTGGRRLKGQKPALV